MSIKVDLTNTGIGSSLLEEKRAEAYDAVRKLWSGDLDFTGWVDLPNSISDADMDAILTAAGDIRKKCDYFIVLGVGGSFMGAKAVIDILEPLDEEGTEVLFAGYNFSSKYIKSLLNKIKGRDICLCVISKSGTTTETLSAYGVFKKVMLEKYGPEETASRTYVVTDSASNFLRDEAQADGCTMYKLATDIGGRYSVLTPVGLLPIAVAGIDIRGLVAGAAKLAKPEFWQDDMTDYAITRQMFYDAGKRIEVFEFFDPYFAYMGEWLKQLFGESEGKDGKGLFPASLQFSRDLHSMGQFLQQGTASFFETFIIFNELTEDVEIPDISMKPFAGKTINQINRCAEIGVQAAHVKAGIPVVSMSMDKISADNIGEMLYFFETSCAVSALLSGVDPFNQPGVEDYKREMRSEINKL